MAGKKILIVEDDADVRLGCHILLTSQGYQPFVAGDAVSAMSQALKHRPDLIILDLGLPGGDGFVMLERCSANLHLSLIPVIVVSAREVRTNKPRALAAGARAYLQKPWDDTVLLTTIGDLLGTPLPAATPAR